MGKKSRHDLIDLSDAVDDELYPIEVLNDYVGELCEKAGSEKPYKVIEIKYSQLFNIAGTLENSIKNIKRVMGECVKNTNVSKKRYRAARVRPPLPNKKRGGT